MELLLVESQPFPLPHPPLAIILTRGHQNCLTSPGLLAFPVFFELRSSEALATGLVLYKYVFSRSA